MSAQVTVTFLVYSNANPAVVTTTTTTIPIPAILQVADSGGNTATGMGAFDAIIAAVARRKGITYVDASGISNFIPLNMITKIVGA